MASSDEKSKLVETEETFHEAEEYHGTPSKSKPKKGIHPIGKKICSDYFGVKSYLHDFYETTYKDPSIYEDEDDFRFLLHPNPRRRRCPPIWWKIFMWVGVNLLVFGIIGILVGYLVSPKPIVFKVDENTDKGFVDHGAMGFNTTLEVCKLVGLILFCVGGMTLAMALLFPSFLTSYCDEDKFVDDSFKVQLDDEEKAPLSPVEMTIPKTAKVKSVQPTRASPESVITQEGVVDYKD